MSFTFRHTHPGKVETKSPPRAKTILKTYNTKENHKVNPSCENVLSLKDTLSAYTKLTFASGENFPFSKKKTYTLLQKKEHTRRQNLKCFPL